MDCVKCGAPLPAKSNICTYCGALNDTDLRAIHRDAKKRPATDRICPRCDIPMQTIELKIDDKFFIERCDRCLGIFFDPNELETLIDASVSHVYTIDHHRMANLIEEEGLTHPPTVKYVKCPVCGELMNRRSYGSRSGVVIDTCKEHGVWLDGGELSQLFKWAKAGGQIHDEKRRAEQERLEESQRKRHEAEAVDHSGFAMEHDSYYYSDAAAFTGLLGFVVRLLR